MDAMGLLLEMGFLASGRPKGFQIDDGTLTLWAEGWDTRCQVVDAAEALSRRTATSYEIQEDLGRVAAILRWPSQPSVWIVSDNPGRGEEERKRWERRGYPTALVSAVSDQASGLVVALTEDQRGYRGHLPRHPDSGVMVQSWH